MENKLITDTEVFIGARALRDQVYLILPTYDSLLEQIQQIRNTARIKPVGTRSKSENNNTFGIFGARGTGKTSVLYTVMEKLEEEALDFVLPIIEPDNFGDNTKIMGSIIGLLNDAVEKEINKIKSLDDKKKYPEFSVIVYTKKITP